MAQLQSRDSRPEETDRNPGGEREFPRPGAAWWGVGLFTLGAILSYTDRQILAILVDPVRASLHLTDTELSVLQGAAFAVLYSVIGLPLGRVADLVPRRALLALAVALWSVGTAACGLSQSFTGLFCARLLVGMGEAALAPASISLIGDYFPATRRATAMGVFLTGIVVGAGAAIGIGGGLLQVAQVGLMRGVPIIGALAPWRVVLLLLGTAGFAMAAAMLSLYEPAGRRFSLAALRARIAGVSEITAAFRTHARLLAPLYGAMACWSIVDYAVLSWSPALLTRRFAFSAGQVGANLGLLAIVGGVIGTPLGGLLVDRVTARRGMSARFRLLVLIASAGILGIPAGVMGTVTGTLASFFCWIFVSSAIGTVSIAAVLDILPQESRGLGTATVAFNNTIVGLGLGPTLVAVITDHFFHDPTAVGYAITLVIAPTIIAAVLLYAVAMVRAGRLSAAAEIAP